MAVVGTMRPEEAKVFDGGKGFHQFTNEDGTKYGSFEVFWHECPSRSDRPRTWTDEDEELADDNLMASGWYWWACRPGCSPEGEPVGPFAKSQYALEDADPNGVE